jgi:hypothetical protein
MSIKNILFSQIDIKFIENEELLSFLHFLFDKDIFL